MCAASSHRSSDYHAHGAKQLIAEITEHIEESRANLPNQSEAAVRDLLGPRWQTRGHRGPGIDRVASKGRTSVQAKTCPCADRARLRDRNRHRDRDRSAQQQRRAHATPETGTTTESTATAAVTMPSLLGHTEAQAAAQFRRRSGSGCTSFTPAVGRTNRARHRCRNQQPDRRSVEDLRPHSLSPPGPESARDDYRTTFCGLRRPCRLSPALATSTDFNTRVRSRGRSPGRC